MYFQLSERTDFRAFFLFFPAHKKQFLRAGLIGGDETELLGGGGEGAGKKRGHGCVADTSCGSSTAEISHRVDRRA